VLGSKARGRPRVVGLDTSILEATAGLLAEVGYDALSIEGVASRAGVGKASIYRRYAGKPDLVAAAADQQGVQQPPEVPRDDLRQALLVTVSWLARGVGEQQVSLLGALFAGMRSDPVLAQAMRRVLERDQLALSVSPAATAIAAGLPSILDGRLFAEVATAMVVHRVVVVGATCDEEFVEHVVDTVLLPLLSTPKPATPSAKPPTSTTRTS
jgi:AcrR family transcriptional regulator